MAKYFEFLSSIALSAVLSFGRLNTQNLPKEELTIKKIESNLESLLLAQEPKREITDSEVFALIQIESSNNPNAVRHEYKNRKLITTSYGLGQLTIETAKDIERRNPELPRLSNDVKEDLFNPEINFNYTSANLQDAFNLYHNIFLAVAAHNSGLYAPRNARVQQQLNEILNTDLITDGEIGPKTKTAIKEFQKIYNLKVDGILGHLTYKKIQEVWISKNSSKPNPVGIIPDNKYTFDHVKKFKRELEKNRFYLITPLT